MRVTMIAYVMSLAALLLPQRGAAACTAPAEATLKLSFDNPALMPSVQATINGKPALLLLDTGSDLTLLSARRPLPLARFSPGISIGGFNGKTRLRKVKVDDFTVGPIALRNTTLPAEQAESIISAHWDGVLGADYLLRYDLDISFATAAITLYPAGSCAPDWTTQAHTIPLVQDGKSLIPRMAATLGTQPALAVADTGATVSLILREFLTTGMPGSRIAATGNKGAGYGGESDIGTVQLSALTLGGQNFPSATWHVTAHNRSGGDDAILLGGDFFAANRVFISSRDAVLYFQALTPTANTPFHPNTDWYASLARQGNLGAQLKLIALASTPAQRQPWQAMAAAQGHVGALTALATQARLAGRLPEAGEQISRALLRDAKFYPALVERYLITQATRSRDAASRELAATIKAEQLDTYSWPGRTYRMLLQQTSVPEFIVDVQQQISSTRQRCSIAGLLRQLHKAGQGWESIASADVARLCPGHNGDET